MVPPGEAEFVTDGDSLAWEADVGTSSVRRGEVRRYQIDFDALDVQSLRELVRLIRDHDHEKQTAVNRARMMPWRR